VQTRYLLHFTIRVAASPNYIIIGAFSWHGKVTGRDSRGAPSVRKTHSSSDSACGRCRGPLSDEHTKHVLVFAERSRWLTSGAERSGDLERNKTAPRACLFRANHRRLLEQIPDKRCDCPAVFVEKYNRLLHVTAAENKICIIHRYEIIADRERERER